MSTNTAVANRGVRLDPALAGKLVRPGDEHFDQARSAWNLAVDQQPAAVILAETAEDVRAAVRLAADALNWCRASRVGPLAPGGTTRALLPETTFRGRQNTKLQYAVLVAAALHGGTEPDLLDEVAWWQSDDFWQYALFAAVAYIRAAASRAGVPVRQACQDLAQRSHGPAP